MKLCLVTNEIFAWGKYGGYGSSARILATELVKRGFSVSAVTPRRRGQDPIDEIDGVRILSYPFLSFREQMSAYVSADAQIYHCLQPNLSAYLVQRAMPEREHVVTCDYVRFPKELAYEMFANIQERRVQPLLSLLYEQNWLTRIAVQRARFVLCDAEFERAKAQEKFRLRHLPEFIPLPFNGPAGLTEKASKPTVCFIGRWEKRKSPETFLELARVFPEVTFVAVGGAQNLRRDQMLRTRYGSLPNVKMPGFIDQFSSPLWDEILSSSWILINTSRLEGLPRTFCEAAVRGCAILSRVNPDGFASRGGYWAQSGDFATGLRTLLSNDEWKRRGQMALELVREHYGKEISIARHAQLYERALRRGGEVDLCKSMKSHKMQAPNHQC